MLSAAQMGRMSRLLDEVLELDAEGRRRWLEALAPEFRDLEPALRRALLSEGNEASPSEELSTLPNAGAASQVNAIGSGLRPGDLVGPYRLMRPLGAGGMAEVWLAQRADGAFKRELALKLPTLSQLRKDLASRFGHERDILAALEHPNIARLYDAGVSAEGLPYLAMEYVAGEPLMAWCNAHRLGIRERLKLFLQVLDAVQYAHGRQVIHRDIKPSNILVSEAGHVRLLDFGVAKLLAPQDGRTEVTRLYGQAFTPEYASPEQVRGEAIDAAADVYSLGVVLYQLLSGSRPYRIEAGASMTLLEQAITTAQVERPSTQVGKDAGAERGTTQDKLARSLRGDLDAIVLKALAKAPADRYASAAAVADDLQRYLGGEPVGARPDSINYRFTKFVLRHRTGVATTAAVATLVLAVTSYELARLPGVRHPPPANDVAPAPSAAGATVSDKSIAVLPFVDMSEKHDQEYFSDGLSEELIDHLSHSPELKVISRTSSFYFKGKQVTIAEVAKTLGVGHVLEGSVRKSGRELRITVQLIRAPDGSHLWSKTFDRSLTDIFRVQDEIAGTVAQSLQIALSKTAADGSTRETNAEAYNLLLQGSKHLSYGATNADNEKAIELFREAIELDPSYALAWIRLAESYSERSFFGSTSEVGNVQRAELALSHALAIDPHLADAYIARAVLKIYFDWDWGSVRTDLETASTLDPNNKRVRLALDRLGVGASGQPNEAMVDLRQELARDPIQTHTFWFLGFAHYFAGRLEESEGAFRSVLQLNPNYASAQAFLARCYLVDDRYSDALVAAEKESDESWRLAILPMVYWALGRRAESDSSLAEEERKYAAGSAFLIAQAHAYRGEADAAFQWLGRARRQHDVAMRWIQADPILRNLRNDPRFKTLLAEMRLVENRQESSQTSRL